LKTLSEDCFRTSESDSFNRSIADAYGDSINVIKSDGENNNLSSMFRIEPPVQDICIFNEPIHFGKLFNSNINMTETGVRK